MEKDFEKQLEELIHRELRKLPDLPAPDTLVSRVRSAIAAQARQPWWQRPLLTWPLAMRVAFIALLVGSLGLAGFYGAEISHGVSFRVSKVRAAFFVFRAIVGAPGCAGQRDVDSVPGAEQPFSDLRSATFGGDVSGVRRDWDALFPCNFRKTIRTI